MNIVENKAFNIVLNPKFKSIDKQYAWINKQLKLLFPDYYSFEFSVLKTSVYITMYGQTWENGQLVRYKKHIAYLKSNIEGI